LTPSKNNPVAAYFYGGSCAEPLLDPLIGRGEKGTAGLELKRHFPYNLQSQKRKTTMSQQGKILGIGGIFFKSANQQQMKEWYGKHLGLADSGHGVMLPWLEKDNPESEQMTIWSIFPATTKYFEPAQASFMVNYIVDDLDALLDRLGKEGVRIDSKRQDESYGRFAWIYDPDGNKIELWQPLNSDK
jgi:catechol 2,3-dioxygenase-like lactoylglutathione lyase family enzyme